MILRIGNILDEAALTDIRTALGDPARFEDGAITAGWHARSVKRNRQARNDAPTVALRRRVGIELAKPENAGHPLNEGNPPIEEKAFRLRDFAAQGDALAISIFKQQGFILGYAIADLVRTFDPGLVVIGGGLAESSFRDDYMGWIKEGFKDRAWPVYCHSPLDPEKETTRFEWAIGGDGAAAIGMAYTARELFQ